MPCAAPERGKTDLEFPPLGQHDPCGLPALTFVGLTDVSAENLCLWHFQQRYGVQKGRWLVQEGQASGWGTPEASGTLGLVNSIYNTSSGGVVTGIPPSPGEHVLVRVNAVVIGEYAVYASQDVQAPGRFAVQGNAVYFHAINFVGVDSTAALAALVATAVTLDWRVV